MTARIICKIRDLRKYKELTQESLAEELGISRQTLIALEQGRSLPSLGLAIEIADFFERDVEEVFNDDFSRALPAQIPAPLDLEILDKGKNIVVNININHINPKDIKIEATENSLIITGEVSQKSQTKGTGFYHQSESFSSFSRVIPLPAKINPDKATAGTEDGMLKVTMPKAEVKKRKEIKITSKKN